MKLFEGDCKIILDKMDAKVADLVYLDPPFYTQKVQKLSTRDGSKKYTFEDSWESIESYKEYIKERLESCKRVLKDTGSIFLHCDRNASHYLRVALDEVFGEKNFQSEIVWSYKRWSNAKKGLLNSHQTIYFYSKTSKFKFNKVFTDYSPTTNLDQIFQERVRDENGKTKYKKESNGDSKLLSAKKGVPLGDVWEIPYLNPKAKERVGYPTQKPILLLEKIIELVTNEGDVVLDPFCGSGTTLVAAKLLSREYIGIDASQDALDLARKRLKNPIKTTSQLLEKGKDAYLNQSDSINEILESFGASPVQRNKGIDGFLKVDGKIKPIPIKIQRKNESQEGAYKKLIDSCKANNFKKKILVVTHKTDQQDLFSAKADYKEVFVIDLSDSN